MTAYISDSTTDTDVKYWSSLDSSLNIILLKFRIDIFHSVKTMSFSTSLKFHRFLAIIYHNFRLNSIYQILMVSSGKFVQIYQSQQFFNFKMYLFIVKYPFLWEFVFLFIFFFLQNNSKVNRFYKFWWLHRKDLINNYQKPS